MTPTVVAVVGPTAAGKSELAVQLAERSGAEVVNADSMQLYRGMDIGTAKLPLGERRGVAHHLIDVWDVTETASVAAYQSLARACVDDILARGRGVVLVGGSGLYVRAVLDDLDFPGTDATLRARLDAEAVERGSAEMHARLAALDPAAAASILPGNARRIVRALEVIELTGRPFTARLPGQRPVYDAVTVGLDVDYADLDRRIDARVERMWSAGFVGEVARLTEHGLRAGRTASRALGYRQVLTMLDGGCDEATAKEETRRATRRFARRQRSWFRRDPGVCWVPAGDAAMVAAQRLLAAAPGRDPRGPGGAYDRRVVSRP